MNLTFTKQYDHKNNSKNKTNWMQQTDHQLQTETTMIINNPQKLITKNDKQFNATKLLPPPPQKKTKNTVAMMYD